MPIGQIRPPRREQAYSRTQVSANSFGAGIGTAVSKLGSQFTDLANAEQALSVQVQQREERKEDFKIQEEWIRFQGEQTRQYQEQLRNSSADAAGITNQTEEMMSAARQEFINSIPERLRDKYAPKIAEFTENKILDAFQFEYEQGNEYFRDSIISGVDTVRGLLETGETTFEDAVTEVHDLIADSDLPEAEKEAQFRKTSALIAATDFRIRAQEAAAQTASVGVPDGSDVVAPGITPVRRGLLNGIAAPESGGAYNRLYSGEAGTQQTFDDYSDHPRIYKTITKGPNKGQKTSAAGRYQFLASTWDAAVKSYNAANPERPVSDFSPVSQDLVAAHWMEVVYNRRNNGSTTFEEIEANPTVFNLAHLREVLTPEWEGLGNISDEEFASVVSGEKGLAGGGTGSASAPNIWTDPKYIDIPYEEKLKLSNAAIKAQKTAAEETRKQIENQRIEQLENIKTMAIRGEATDDTIQDAREKGIIKTASEEKQVRTLINDARDRESSRREVGGKLESGDPMNPSRDGQGLDAFIGDDARTALYNRDMQAYNAIRNASLRAGFIPPETKEVFSGMLGATDPRQQAFALSSLSTMLRDNPALLDNSNFTSAQVGEVSYFNDQRKFFPEGEAGDLALVEHMRSLKEGAAGRTLEDMRKEARETFGDEFENPDDLLDQWDGWTTSAPEMPPTSAQRSRFLSDMQQAYTRAYMETGDKELAKRQMEAWANQHWAVSDFTGNRQLMKMPPELVWKDFAIDGNLDWARDQLVLDMGLKEDERFALVATETTKADYAAVQKGERDKPPRYKVIRFDATGRPSFNPEKDWYPEVNADVADEAMSRAKISRAEGELATAKNELNKVGQLLSALDRADMSPELARNAESLNLPPREELEARREQAQEQVTAAENELEELRGRAPEQKRSTGEELWNTIAGDVETAKNLSDSGKKAFTNYLSRILLPEGFPKKEPLPEGATMEEVFEMLQHLTGRGY